jgi:hypothetical protein
MRGAIATHRVQQKKKRERTEIIKKQAVLASNAELPLLRHGLRLTIATSSPLGSSLGRW